MIPRDEVRRFAREIGIEPATWAERLFKLSEETHEYTKAETQEEKAKELADIIIVSATIQEKAAAILESWGRSPLETVRAKMREVVDRGR